MKLMSMAALAFSALATVAAAQEPQEIAALDVAVDAATLEGKALKVTGCTIIGANISFMMCGIKSKTGTVGNLHVGVEKLDRAQFKQALQNCAGLMPAKGCGATIIGSLGKTFTGEPSIIAEQIVWVK
ncbi:hypothetical protein J5N58_16900 [Rhizobium cremeum]|uniref:hypothetical protein n=1 Tax=Rhizobium cremeum TaxID=2813827 RepID=UPI001FD574A2|nr:hypothetical protein [Rhizobium cremeum]MCJ7996099.1 hypothetical protein [Rhizobium cremeum]MCJ8001358.1 hypothetical protein [Rhizobium cremeum]